jgi:hypothetical protein
VATADIARRKLRLGGDELAAVAALGTGNGRPSADANRLLAQSLRGAGVTPDGRLAGWVDELLTVVARPALRLVVEMFTADRPTVSVWATPAVAVVGEPAADGDTELTTVELVTVPYVITLFVGLRRRPRPPGREPIRISAAEFAALERSVADSPAGPDGPAGAITRESDPALVDMLRRQRASWRIESVWVDGSGRRTTKTLHVVDADEAGLWRLQVQDATLVFTPSSAGDTWRHIIGLLPSEEVRA